MTSTPKPPISFRRRVLYSLLRIGRLCLVLYLGVILVLLWFEYSLIYPAPKYDPAGNWNAASTKAEDVNFTSADGTRLHGWYWRHPQPRAYLLYCHGNGECVADCSYDMLELSKKYDLAVFAFDYRGYGRSEGSPHEKGILEDAAAARNWLAKDANIPPDQIVLMGRSIGGAVAVDLAANDGARGLILQNTFTSLPDIAAPMYWFLPVRLVMKSQYRSAEKIVNYHGPLLQSHGTADSLIPYANGRKLFDLAPGEKVWFEFKDGGHNDLEPGEYEEVLREFFAKLK